MSHAQFPPSGAERWLKCGYSVKMAPLFPNVENVWSKEGTKQHAIASMHLINGTEPGNNGLRLYTDEVRKVAQDGELFVEHKVVIIPGLCWGTLDAAVTASDCLYLLDLKWGTSVVHATDNPQLKLYALGMLRQTPTPWHGPIRLTIVQPNGASGWPVKHWETTVEHVMKFLPKMETAIEEALKPEPKAVAGSHCYWCPAKLHCHAYLLHTGKKS